MKTALLILTMVLTTTIVAEAKNVDREMARASTGSGTNVGGGNISSEYLSTWCRGQSSLLRNFRDRARLKLENTGDYKLANKILTDGMIQALGTGNEATQTFLHKSLVRGLTISTQLGATQVGTSEKKGMITNNILNNYYEFMIGTVARDLDLNGQIPYLNSGRDRLDERAAQFETKFVLYAITQLDWISQNLVKEVRFGNRTQVVPVGDARSVLKVILTLTGATATDLNESLWNYRFSCAISDLNVLNESLKAYDQGNKEMFEDEKQALVYASTEVARISKTLSLKESCQ